MSSGRAVQLSPAASARRAVAVCMGKAARTGVRRLGPARSAAIAGKVTLAIDPGALASLLGELGRGYVLVTGSTGKGTTCQLLARVMRAAGLCPVLNTEGSAKRSALAAAMVVHAAPSGHMRSEPQPIGLIEADEGSLAEIIRHVAEPAAIVCTNLFRDRRDRDLESADATALLERALRSLPASTTLILNADDPRVADLAPDLPNPRLYFGISDPALGRVRADPTSGFPRCPRCDGELSYACVYYAHLGHWACGACGLSRPQPDISVTKVDLVGPSSIRLQVATATADRVFEIPLPGMYHVYNAVAAIAAATQSGLPDWSLAAIEQVAGGAGRMECIPVSGHEVYLARATNAIGYTEILRAVLGDGEPRRMLLGLDDMPGKQPDTSWIWDVDFGSLAGLVPGPIVSGNRAADLAVRLKYAGWLGDGQDRGQSAGATIEPDPVRAFQAAIAATPPGQPLWIVSTSTGLWQLRRWLRQHGYVHDDAHEQRSHTRSRLAPAAAVTALTRPPGRPGPQPSAPPLSGRRPMGLSRRGRHRRRQRGQSGAAR
jgi:lipid II isoglutaminyl synthase (glutamine-hydrolysing)